MNAAAPPNILEHYSLRLSGALAVCIRNRHGMMLPRRSALPLGPFHVHTPDTGIGDGEEKIY